MTHQHASVSKLLALLSAAALLLFLSPVAYGQNVECGELIVNGNFEAGNSGFTTQYSYHPEEWGLYGSGTYTVFDNPYWAHHGFGGVDHTTGTGMFIMINGSEVPNLVVWEQQVPVLANTTYALSAWVNTVLVEDESPAVLKFLVNGVQVGSNFTGPSVGYDWSRFTASWNSGSATTTATIQIIDLNTDHVGNDFGLDDISFKKVDVTAPTLTVATGLTMWPPNHEYHSFSLLQLVSSVTDDCGAAMVYISGAGSDEAENATGLGDGDTSDDIVIAANCQSVMLRAERQGGGNGRVYTVYVTAVDYAGNYTTVECKIAVRHDVNGSATDDGVLAGYTVTGTCGSPAKAVAMRGMPAGFALEQNFPNPFNPSTEIRFHVAEDSELRLIVLDALGRQVAVLASGNVAAGTHTVTFQADNLPSGLYFYRLEAQGRAVTKRMMLMK